MDGADLIRRDLDVFWHPCSQMRDKQAFPPLPVVAAEGCRLTLADGRELIDGISSWWCKALGHRHPRLIAALQQQAARFEHVIMANVCTEPTVRLCERLLAFANGLGPSRWGPQAPAGRAPGWFGKVFLAGDGSTAVEIAIKMALQFQAQTGRPQRTRFAALADGYHGEGVGSLSVGDLGIYKEPYRPLLFPCHFLTGLPRRSGCGDPRWQDAAAEWPAIQAQLDPLADSLAAIIYEPVLQAAGGMLLNSPDLLRRLRAWADGHGVLLIADEIAAGMGRCGAPLAGHLAAVDENIAQPDFAVLSKGLTGGALPLAAVLTRDRIAAAFAADWHENRAFLHSNTYTGHALACAVANAALDAFADEPVFAAVGANGPLLRAGLEQLAATRPYLHRARGLGMVAAIDLARPDGSPLPASDRTGWRVCHEAVARGALLRPLGDTLYLLPPLNTSADDLGRLVVLLGQSLDAVLG